MHKTDAYSRDVASTKPEAGRMVTTQTSLHQERAVTKRLISESSRRLECSPRLLLPPPHRPVGFYFPSNDIFRLCGEIWLEGNQQYFSAPRPSRGNATVAALSPRSK